MENKETYERLEMKVTQFDTEDVITTSSFFNTEMYEDAFLPPSLNRV